MFVHLRHPELLESRLAMAAWGLHEVTFSFHPSLNAELDPAGAEVLAGQGDENGDRVVDIHDVAVVSNNWGTPGFDIFAVAKISNNWNRTASDVWKDEFRAAAKQWDEACGVTLIEVEDDGSPLGTFGSPQHDPRFGDVRIGAAELDGINPAFIAYTNLPSAIGTSGGDIKLDLKRDWSCDPQHSGIDVFSLAIHEFGHSLGLDHDNASDTVMYPNYRFYTGLFPKDVTKIRGLYGLPASASDAVFNELGR